MKALLEQGWRRTWLSSECGGLEPGRRRRHRRRPNNRALPFALAWLEIDRRVGRAAEPVVEQRVQRVNGVERRAMDLRQDAGRHGRLGLVAPDVLVREQRCQPALHARHGVDTREPSDPR